MRSYYYRGKSNRPIPQKPRKNNKSTVKKILNLFKDIVLALVIIIVTGIIVLIIVLPSLSVFMGTHNPVADTIKPILNLPTETTIDKSKESLDYINKIRASYDKHPLNFDIRVYNLAKARVNDLDKYGYFDHTNPTTGTCAWSIKSLYGLSSNEDVAENLGASDISVNEGSFQHKAYFDGLETETIDSWLTSRGHRYNLLYTDHISGAVYCSSNSNCIFLGLNHDGFGNGCSSGTEGMAFWNQIGRQPGEV